MWVGRVAGVLEDGGGVDVEVLAAEHQAGPAAALLCRCLRNLHLALAWLTHHSSLQERFVRDPGVSDQKIPAGGGEVKVGEIWVESHLYRERWEPIWWMASSRKERDLAVFGSTYLNNNIIALKGERFFSNNFLTQKIYF